MIPTQYQRAVVWPRLVADNHPMLQLIKQNADTERYADNGQYAALYAGITGDRGYLRKAYEKFTLGGWSDERLYNSSHYAAWGMVEEMLLCHVTKPVMTPDERAACRAFFIKVADKVMAFNRIGDSDQTIGHFMGLLLCDLVWETSYSTGAWTDADTGKPFPMGGFLSTGADFTSVRNVVRYYVEVLAEGGTFIESSEYNENTPNFLNAAHFIDILTGRDNFPEIKRYRAQLLMQQMFEVTPDLKETFKFGDNQIISGIRLAVHIGDLWNSLAYLEGPTQEQQEAFRQFIEDVFAANGVPYLQTQQSAIFARHFYYVDPYKQQQKRDWKPLLPKAYFSKGQGHLYTRTGDTATHVHFMDVVRVDHQGAFGFGDVRTYKNGQWLRSHPLAYMPDLRMLTHTIPYALAVPAVESVSPFEHAFDGKVAYASRTAAGHTQLYGTYGNVRNAHHETGRYFFKLLDGPQIVEVSIDRSHVEDPRDLYIENQWGRFDWLQQYAYTAQHDAIRAIENQRLILEHMPVEPTVEGNTTRWGNVKLVEVFSTAPLKTKIVDERTAGLGGYMNPDVLKWATWKNPVEKVPFMIFAHAFTDSADVTFEKVEVGTLIGVKVNRPNMDPVTFLVPSTPGPKLETDYEGPDRIRFNPDKYKPVLEARKVTQIPAGLPGGTVYITDVAPDVQGNRVGPLVSVNGPVVVPEPEPVPCAYVVLPMMVTIPANGGSAVLNVTRSRPDCAITFQSNAPWLVGSLISGASVSVQVAKNDAAQARSGTIVVAGKTVVINQDAAVVAPPAPVVVCKIDGIEVEKGEHYVDSSTPKTHKATRKKMVDAGFRIVSSINQNGTFFVEGVCEGVAPTTVSSRSVKQPTAKMDRATMQRMNAGDLEKQELQHRRMSQERADRKTFMARVDADFAKRVK